MTDDKIEAWLSGLEEYSSIKMYTSEDVLKLLALVRVYREDALKLRAGLEMIATIRDCRSCCSPTEARDILDEAHAAEEKAKEIVK